MLDDVISELPRNFPAEITTAVFQLSPQQAVYWATKNVKRLVDPDIEPALRGAVKATERWLSAQNETNRLAALFLAESLDYLGISGWLAASCAWSSGTITDPRVSSAPVAVGLTQKAAVAAVLEAISSLEEASDMHFQALIVDAEKIRAL